MLETRYVLMWQAYEDTWPIGVYSTVERAQHAAEKDAKRPVRWSEPNERHRYWHGYTESQYPSVYTIHEFKVDEHTDVRRKPYIVLTDDAEVLDA